MVQFNKERKLFNLYQTQLRNEISLERKNNKNKKQYLSPPVFKMSRVLYDSDWINVTNNFNGDIVGPGIDQDPNAFGDLHFFAQARHVPLPQRSKITSSKNFQSIKKPLKIKTFRFTDTTTVLYKNVSRKIMANR